MNNTTLNRQGIRIANLGRQRRIEAASAYLFIMPMVLGFILFMLGPILFSFGRSFTDWSLASTFQNIGFDNYVKLFTKDRNFSLSLVNTLKFTLFYAPLKIALGLFLAVLLNKKLKGITLYRTILFTPVVTTQVVWGIVWRLIFATNNGLVNQFLNLFGIENINWLYNKGYAMYVVVFIALLKNVGMNVVLFLAALQDVPDMYHEASYIDGANKRQTFWKITLPLLGPSLFLVSIITFINSFKVFTSIYVITNGGPAKSTYVMVFYLYQQAFGNYQFGYASAIAVVLFVIIMACTLIQWKARKRLVFFEK